MSTANAKIKSAKEVYFWKGKRVTENVYKNRLRMVEAGKVLRERIRQSMKHNLLKANPNSYASQETKIPEGRRIIDIKEIANNLICNDCNEVLSLQDIVSEKRCGVAGLFEVQCRKCLFFNSIVTDKVHETVDRKIHFDVNSKIALGKFFIS